MKTLALEDIYADPHKIDFFIDSGEPVEVVRDGRAVAELVPLKAAAAAGGASTWPPVDFPARFLRMWGPHAFGSKVPVADLFDELRRPWESPPTGAELLAYFRAGGSGVSHAFLDAVEQAAENDPLPNGPWT